VSLADLSSRIEQLPLLLVWECILDASLAAGLVCLLALALRLVARDRVRAWVWCVLWMIILVRLVMPWTPSSALSVQNAAGAAARQIGAPRAASLRSWLLSTGGASGIDGPVPTASAGRVVSGFVSGGGPDTPAPTSGRRVQTADGFPPAHSDTAQSAQSFATGTIQPAPGASVWTRLSSLLLAATLVWLVGAGVIASRLARAYVQSRRIVAASEPVTDPAQLNLLEHCRRSMRVSRVVALRRAPASGEEHGACVAGVFQPVIVLSRDDAGLSTAELRSVLLHELAHVRRWDLLTGWLWGVALALHWFNPLVWTAAACMRRDREVACDQAALEALASPERLGYGRTLVKIAESVLTRARTQPRPALIASVVGMGGIGEVSGAARPAPRRSRWGRVFNKPHPAPGANDPRWVHGARAHLHRRCTMITRFRPTSRWSNVAALGALSLAAVAGLTGPSALAQPRDSGAKLHIVDSDQTRFELYFKPYKKNEAGHVAVKNVELVAMPRYHGVNEDGTERTIDSRFTLVVQDAAEQFWPVICRLSKKDAANLYDALDQAAKMRLDAKQFAGRLARGDAQKQTDILAEILQAERDRGPAVLNMRHGAVALQDDNMAALPEDARLEVKMPGEMDYRTTLWINGARDGSGWYAVVYADQTTTEKLRDQVGRILGKDPGMALQQHTGVISAHLLTAGVKLNEYKCGDLAQNSRFSVAKVEKNAARLSLADGASGNPVAEVVLSESGARGLISELRAHLDQRRGQRKQTYGQKETTGKMTACIAAQPYEIGKDGRVELGVVTIRALPSYNGVNLDGSQIVDSRITIVADDEARGFWPILARVDDDVASKLADDLEAALK
jgi:beta-lactamase regulating signal transducer with metallopeptidase domain